MTEQPPGARGSTAEQEQIPGEGLLRRRDEVPGWYRRGVLFTIGALLATAAGLYALQRVQDLVVLLVVSLFLSFAIEPVVDRLADRGWRRGVATGAVFAGVFVFFVAFVTLMGSLLVNQVSALVQSLPDNVASAISWFNQTFHRNVSSAQLVTQIQGWLGGAGNDIANGALGFASTAFGLIISGLAVLLFTFYFSAEGPRFRKLVCSLFPPARQEEILRAWDIAVDKTGGYVISRAMMGTISAIAHGAFFAAIGVPNAVALGIWVGIVGQFIPTLGTYLAVLLPALVGLTLGVTTVAWIIIFAVLYQQIENYLLSPRLTRITVAVHPAVAFGSVLAGTALLGAVGTLLAIPVAAILTAFASAYVRRYDVAPVVAAQRSRRPSLFRSRKADKTQSPHDVDERAADSDPAETACGVSASDDRVGVVASAGERGGVG